MTAILIAVLAARLAQRFTPLGRRGRFAFAAGIAGLVLLASQAAAAERDPAALYSERARKLEDTGRAKDWLALADFCEGTLLLDQRREALDRAIARDPDDALARERRDEARCGREWLPVAEAYAREAEAQGAAGRMFVGARWMKRVEAEAALAADRHHVGWDFATRVDGPHALVYSSEPLIETRCAALLLEHTGAAYQRLHAPVWKQAPRLAPFTVYLCRDLEQLASVYLRATGKGLPGGCDGQYSTATKILFVAVRAPVGYPASRFRGVMVHEFTHGLDHVLSGGVVESCKEWIREGRADYLRCSHIGFQVVPGASAAFDDPAERRDLAQALSAPRLRALLEQDALDAVGYREAMAFVYVLAHGEDGRLSRGFARFLAGAPARLSVRDLEQCLGATLEELEPRFAQDARKRFGL